MYNLDVKYKKSETDFKFIYSTKSEDGDNLLFTLHEILTTNKSKLGLLSNFLRNLARVIGDNWTARVKPVVNKNSDHPYSLEIIIGSPKLSYKTMQAIQKLVDEYLLKRAFDFMTEEDERAGNKNKQRIQDHLDQKLGIDRMSSIEKANLEISAALIGYVKSIRAASSILNSGGNYTFKVEILSKGKTLLQKSNKIQNMSEIHRDIASGLFMGVFSSKNQDPARAKTAINSFFEYLEARMSPVASAKDSGNINITPAKALKMFKDKGYKVVKNPSGSFTITPPKK